MNNIFWVGNLNTIGGVETFMFELAKMFQDYDFIIYYNNIPLNQLNRLKKYVKCIKYTGEKLKCKKLFMNYDISIIDNVDASEYIEIIHCVFKYNSLPPHIHPKITKYYAVGQEACNSFKEITGLNCEVLHNPLNIEQPKKVLKLISATRLASDKGKILERIKKLSSEFKKNNIPFIWFVFTTSEDTINDPNIVFLKPTLDIRNYIISSDYLIQLSDTEAFCYSVLESLYLDTPVIVTPIPCFKEMGVQNGVNSYVLDFDMTNIPVKEIYENIPKFKYKPLKNEWENKIIKVKSTYKEELKMKVKVQCVRNYYDMELKTNITTNPEDKNYERIISRERADYLVSLGLVEIKEIIKEEKEVQKAVVPKTKVEKSKRK